MNTFTDNITSIAAAYWFTSAVTSVGAMTGLAMLTPGLAAGLALLAGREGELVVGDITGAARVAAAAAGSAAATGTAAAAAAAAVAAADFAAVAAAAAVAALFKRSCAWSRAACDATNSSSFWRSAAAAACSAAILPGASSISIGSDSAAFDAAASCASFALSRDSCVAFD